jgi:gluconokinase
LSCILAIDIGTTSTKALLVQPDGKVLLASQAFYSTSYPTWGFAEQDPTEILEAVKKIIQVFTQEFKDEISGVSFSCAMHSLIAVDSKGKALSPAIIWSDIRSHQQAKKLKESILGDKIFKATGTPIHPMSPFCKLIWLKENQPDFFESVFKFVSIKEFIFYHFLGVWEVDYSIASATGLFDVHHLSWMPDALMAAGINEAKLSKSVSPYTCYRELNESVRKDLNISANTYFVIGASDGCLANLGTGVTKAGELTITIGTSGAVRTTSKAFNPDPHHRLFNYRLDENYFVTGGATNNGSVLLNWFNENFLKGSLDIGSMIEDGMSVGVGAEGLIFLPYVYGERAPFYNPHARGVFFGLAQHHTNFHMIRSILEGICFEIKSICQAVEENTSPVTKIVASGGFTQSAKWVQLLADILGKEICVNDLSDGSALGAAKMGFNALNISYNFSENINSKAFTPNPESRALYDRYFALFSELTFSLQDKFDRIATDIFQKGDK